MLKGEEGHHIGTELSSSLQSVTTYGACLGIGELDALELCLLLAHQHCLLFDLLAKLHGQHARLSACMLAPFAK